MNVYDYIDLFAVAIRDNAAVKNYCVTNWNKGLLIQIDDDNEGPIGSPEAPYCVLMSMPGGDSSPVADMQTSNIRIEIGTVPISSSKAPYRTDTTARTSTANGLRKFGAGEKAVDLLKLCLAAVNAVNIDNGTLQTGASIDANGSLLFPLALAVTNITVEQNKTMASWG